MATRWYNRAVIGICAAVVSGCSHGLDFGEDVSMPQAKQHHIPDAVVRGASLAFPTDGPFNVTDSQRESTGPAQAHSQANAHGAAHCSADASYGGAARAEFQLGQVVHYNGETPCDTTVTFDVQYESVVHHLTNQSGTNPVGLKAYVSDSNQRMLAKSLLIDGGATPRADRSTGSQTQSFDVTFEPGLAYHLILAGRVAVSGDDTTGPSVSLSTKSLRIEIVPRTP